MNDALSNKQSEGDGLRSIVILATKPCVSHCWHTFAIFHLHNGAPHRMYCQAYTDDDTAYQNRYQSR